MKHLPNIALLLTLISFPGYNQSKIDSHDPVWSPDGERIAFYSNRDGDFEIYVVNKDGSMLQQITSNEVQDGSPSWSSDGKKLLFNSSRKDRKELYTYDFSSGKTNQLTMTEGSESASAWSPDGRYIVFESNIDGPRDLFIMNSDGSNIRNLTRMDSNDFRPSWSSDSRTIYFNSNRNGKYQLFKMDLDGKVEQLNVSNDHQVSPVEMHNQHKIVFANHSDMSVDISILDLSSKAIEIVPHGEGDVMLPSFSPDDKEILYVLIKDGVSRICIMNYETHEWRYLVDF